MDIRAAQRGEAEALTRLTHRSKAHWGYPDELMDLWMDELRVTPEYLDQNPAFVAGPAGTPKGYYSFTCCQEPGAWGDLQVPAGWWLDNLFVEPAHIGMGLGTKLFRHALHTATARGLGRFYIVSDPGALGFYRRMGAVLLGEKPSSAMPGHMLPVLRMDLSRTPPRLALRPATAADADRLTELTALGKRHWRHPEATLRQWDSCLQVTPQYIRDNPTWAAEVNGNLDGYASFVWQGGTLAGDTNIDPAWWLDGLFIDPVHIGLGLGRRLYEKAAEAALAQGITAFYIASDPNALGFYKRMGAQHVASQPTPIPDYVKPILLHRLTDTN